MGITWNYFCKRREIPKIQAAYCCLVRAEKMDDEMDEAFRKLNEKRKDETKLWQGEDQE